MHKEFQILKVPDMIAYKLLKLIHSLQKDSPIGFQRFCISKTTTTTTKSIHIRKTRNRHQVYSKREKNPVGKRKLKVIPTLSRVLGNYSISIIYLLCTLIREDFIDRGKSSIGKRQIKAIPTLSHALGNYSILCIYYVFIMYAK